ncbi:host attachment protein [Microbulbifer thermotolerans]|uniref:Host cell attachment-required protein n=1 Tax=Microbulbifer thermotolerans TaxID=252514 RepID=A0A143HRX6_MICTH|nr:host attachment protein [Microbulbifer thermotolerans]AMX04227.1 host cell attachment-required protein [Microbulbifer thermotolerans]WKT59852.1 host attachment protein [Microbulbifer thermotolerans]SFC58060.1 Protein required for attachment to host cells [Microbulbifer thermotolerans]
MAHAWVLVANQSEARLFEAEKRSGELHELESMIYPQSRMSGRDLISDAPGRTFDSGGQGRHAMGNTEQLHRLSGRKFARELAQTLERGRTQGLYEKLYIVAEPQMVGNLREALKPPTRAAIAGETGKNLVNQAPGEIRAQLPRWL